MKMRLPAGSAFSLLSDRNMAAPPFQSRLILDVGLSMGDEGKGRLVPEIVEELRETTDDPSPVGVVLKVNGGANSGHTSGGLKLNLFPAGVICADVPVLAIGSGVVADPHKFLWEAAYIESRGYSVLDRLLIDERTMVSDFGHRLLDLAWETYRVDVLGEETRGSTGRGISPAYVDETGCFPLHYAVFREGKDAFAHKLKARLRRACATIQHVCEASPQDWERFFETLTQAETRAHQAFIGEGLFAAHAFDFAKYKGGEPFTLNEAALVDDYWMAGTRLARNIGDVREALFAARDAGRAVIGEFGQAFWLDKRFGFPPNVTSSHTLPAEFFLSAGMPVQPVHIVGACKAYDTKVGTHTFISRIPDGHPLGERLKKLEFGVTTGRQRMVGWYDAVEKGDAIRYGGCQDICLNKLDALTYGGDWQGGELLVCVAYRAPDGTIHHHVPRAHAQHTTWQPVYLQLPGWSEDISAVRRFVDLPAAARRYIATLYKATVQVAFGAEKQLEGADLPHLRYIGVGPDPSQIIRDTPPPRELLALA